MIADPHDIQVPQPAIRAVFNVTGWDLNSMGSYARADALARAVIMAWEQERQEWWTTKDVATFINVDLKTVSTYRRRGQMPAPDTMAGRTHLWNPIRIIAWQMSRPRPGVGGRRSRTPQ